MAKAERRDSTDDRPDRLSTHDSRLDAVLHGGLPVGALTVVGGAWGCGKSLLAHQVCRPRATDCLYAVCGGAPARVYNARFAPPHPEYYDVSPALWQQGAEAVVAELAERIAAQRPSVVVIDSLDCMLSDTQALAHQHRLLYRLSEAWVGTETSVIGLLTPEGLWQNCRAAAEAATLVLWLEAERGCLERRLRVIKYEGSGFETGQHTFTVTDRGLVLGRNLDPLPAQEPLSALSVRILRLFETTRTLSLTDLAGLLGHDPDLVRANLDGLVAIGRLARTQAADGRPEYSVAE